MIPDSRLKPKVIFGYYFGKTSTKGAKGQLGSNFYKNKEKTHHPRDNREDYQQSTIAWNAE